MDRRKELKEQYKHMKPDMGIFIIRSSVNKKYYIEGSQNIKGTINRTKFQLDLGKFSNKELQKEWADHGESRFIIEVLDTLKYDKDESKTEYKEDLDLLKMIWEEKLSIEGMHLYQKSGTKEEVSLGGTEKSENI